MAKHAVHEEVNVDGKCVSFLLVYSFTLSHSFAILSLTLFTFTASKDLAQTSYFMATNRLLSRTSFVALWLHTIASFTAGYPTSVQHPPCTGGNWDAPPLRHALTAG